MGKVGQNLQRIRIITDPTRKVYGMRYTKTQKIGESPHLAKGEFSISGQGMRLLLVQAFGLSRQIVGKKLF